MNNKLIDGRLYAEFIGYLTSLIKKKKDEDTTQKRIDELKNTYISDSAAQKTHLRYLKELFEYEETRQDIIERKLSLIVGQTGIVFSLSSLFIPLLYKQFASLNLYEKSILLLPYIISLYYFIRSIHHSLKTLEPTEYTYSTGNPITVTKYNTNKEFLEVEIKDLFTSITKNVTINNKKVEKLVKAQEFFRGGIYFFALFLFCLVVLLFLDNLLGPDVFAKEIIENLEATIESLKEIMESLVAYNYVN